MKTDRTASAKDIQLESVLPQAYQTLNDQRMDIDRRMLDMEPDDPGRDVLWQEFEPVMEALRGVVESLANSPASDLPQLRAKAAVLASLLQGGHDHPGPIIPENEKAALALAITDDIERLFAR